MIKKRLVLFSVLIVGLVFSAFLVSAQSIAEDLNKVINGFIEVVTPVAANLLGTTPSGELLFAKILFLLIILAVAWTALGRIDFFSERTWVLAIISIGVSILATRWLGSAALVQTILLPYSALGIAITAALPFVIYFILINVGLEGPGYSTVRRIAWIFFAVIFIGLWFTRRPTITAEGSYAGYIYPVTALLAFIMASMDGTIQGFFARIWVDRRTHPQRIRLSLQLQRELAQIDEDMAQGRLTRPEHDGIARDIRRRIYNLRR